MNNEDQKALMRAAQPSLIALFRAAATGRSHLPEVAFYMVGSIEEAVEKAERLAAEAA